MASLADDNGSFMPDIPYSGQKEISAETPGGRLTKA
jgi:hypothetical protein